MLASSSKALGTFAHPISKRQWARMITLPANSVTVHPHWTRRVDTRVAMLDAIQRRALGGKEPTTWAKALRITRGAVATGQDGATPRGQPRWTKVHWAVEVLQTRVKVSAARGACVVDRMSVDR